MSVFKVASRYAKSLLDLANEQGNLEQDKQEIEDIASIMKSSSELRAVLNNPIIKIDKKQRILEALFKEKVRPEVLGFLNILVRKGRSEIVYPTLLEFIREYNELKGIVKAQVVSASALTEASIAALRENIAKQIGADVVLTNKVDRSLIGGFVVTVGDRQIDTSIAGKLDSLERHFKSEAV